MERHEILSKKFSNWWAILATISYAKYYLIGLPHMAYYNGYAKYGALFWTIATLLSSLIYAAIPYLIYRIIKKKWDNKVYMILICAFIGLLLIFL